MNSLKDEFNEILNIENDLLSRDFISPLLFPDVNEWTSQNILYVGMKDENSRTRTVSSRLAEEFPGANTRFIEIESFCLSPNSFCLSPNSPTPLKPDKNYDYIIAPALKYAGKNYRPSLKILLEHLTDSGVIAGSVYGYAGNYGLFMLHKIVLSLCSDFILHGTTGIIDNKTLPKISLIISAVLERLPANHPAFENKTFIDSLKKGNRDTINELIGLSEDRLFSVPRLLDEIEKSGGQFLNWVKPGLYDPGRYMESQEIYSRFKTLRVPYRWKIAELVNAGPAIHFFLAKKH